MSSGVSPDSADSVTAKTSTVSAVPGAGSAPERVSSRVLAAYGSLAFPLAAAFIALQVIVPTFYAENTSLSLAAIGGILLLARLFDTVTDPLVGYWSDQSTAKFGRRKLFVVVAAPMIGIAVWFLFNPVDGAGAGYLLFWTIAIYVAGTLSIVPASAWAAELSPDYNQRSLITGIRVAFGLAGTLAALIVPALLAGNSAENLGSTLRVITLLVVVTLLFTTVWAAFSVPDTAKTTLPRNSITAAWALMKTRNPFRQLLVSFLLNAVANAIPATLFLLFVTHVLGEPELAGVFLFLYFIFAAAAVPFWVAVSRRFGKHRTWSVAMLLACLFFLWTPFLDSDTVFWFYVIVIATGFATGADLALPSAINADVIEWDALESGYTRPGLFFALWGTASKLSYALAVGIAFPLLDLAGFSAVDDNTTGALTWLAILYGAPCILFKLAAIWTMRDYPITQSVHADIRKQLEERQIQTTLP
ncbi:MAG: MFS transporter [Granulosicoccus sp.]